MSRRNRSKVPVFLCPSFHSLISKKLQLVQKTDLNFLPLFTSISFFYHKNENWNANINSNAVIKILAENSGSSDV